MNENWVVYAERVFCPACAEAFAEQDEFWFAHASVCRIEDGDVCQECGREPE